ncbi:ABC transporter ATP-binding protein [Macrococcus epidermidis]|uniref:ABC transporter ATP-binding protein n=1 Tax=Macrococcus epidermidis TaxID=1902580 RepID=A0A327ZMR4_9STAP|nr:ABC transporter ATP-binding protein [Macrococcus epidermidis]RAK43700.1 ABC transporter ATP-binding protein [Macrococcus epidermidis]
MITIHNLSKDIDKKHILKHINLTINKGDTIALVGPNGAGKSTLIDCLLGNKKLTSGDIDGQHLILDHTKTSVLYQQTYFTPNMKVYQIIELFQNLYPNALTKEEIKAITLFDDALLNTEAEKISGGQKRILDVALTLIGRPEFIILDEPTVGMDTSTRRRFYDLIKTLKSEGKTILFTSHYIEEVESLSERIVVLHQGEIVRDSTPRALREESTQKQLVLPRKYENVTKQISDIAFSKIEGEYIVIHTSLVDEVIKVLIDQQISFEHVEITNESLLDRVFKAVEEERHETV